MSLLRVGNASGFWGDRPNAAAQLLQQQPDLHFLTLDYLAEISLSIMAIQREKDSSLGYAKDFVDVIHSLIPLWNQGMSFKVVTNAGGLNPKACAEACKQALNQSSCNKKIGIVTGDNVLPLLKQNADHKKFINLDSHLPLSTIQNQLVSANAYLGSRPIATALEAGAEIVITGRVADPCLTVGPALYHFGWQDTCYNKIAGATIAGHLIECGTQVTGGISTKWLEIDNPVNLGFPFVEIHPDGTFGITKPHNTGGIVSIETVKEQLLYEIGDPDNYISPDITVSFLSLELAQKDKDYIHVSGAIGKSPTSSFKVSATYRAGFKAEAFLAVFGQDAKEKAQRSGEIILERVRQAGYPLAKTCIECFGTGTAFPAVKQVASQAECILRIAVADENKQAVEYFAKEIAPMVTSGPQGITGYTSGRPHVRPLFGYWPCLIEKKLITPNVELI